MTNASFSYLIGLAFLRGIMNKANKNQLSNKQLQTNKEFNQNKNREVKVKKQEVFNSSISSTSIISKVTGVSITSDTNSNAFNYQKSKAKNAKFISIASLIKDNRISDLESMLKTNTINPNQRDEGMGSCSFTPLYWSVKLNKIECVELLLNHGADATLVVNDPLECYGTALDLATLLGLDEIEEVIRKYIHKDSENKNAYKAIRTKLRGNAQSFNFKSHKRIAAEAAEKLLSNQRAA